MTDETREAAGAEDAVRGPALAVNDAELVLYPSGGGAARGPDGEGVLQFDALVRLRLELRLGDEGRRSIVKGLSLAGLVPASPADVAREAAAAGRPEAK